MVTQDRIRLTGLLPQSPASAGLCHLVSAAMETAGDVGQTAQLSRERYLAVLEQAKARGFELVRFRDFLPGGPALPERYVVLRHDVDFAPEYSLELAELEHEAGVASTFFVLVDGRFYNPLDKEVVGQVRRIHSLGHEVGLHFSAGDDVALRLRLLSELVGAPVRSCSQHDPAN